jgi:hypothetical protein
MMCQPVKGVQQHGPASAKAWKNTGVIGSALDAAVKANRDAVANMR